MLFKQPPGCLPGVPTEARILARVPVYGTKDAGRKFWKKLRKTFIEAGLKENHVMKALYSFCDADGELQIMCGTHVDDLIWAAKPEYEHMIRKVTSTFQCGEPEEKCFRYCGKEVTQDDDFNIVVTCRSTTMKLEPIRVKPGRKNGQQLNDEEKTQMKSVAGSLQWIARQVRPELDFRTSKIQQIASTGKVQDIKFANKVVRYARETADRGLTFKACVIDWRNMVNIVVTDASHANECEVGITPTGIAKEEPHRSQGGRLQLLSNAEETSKDALSCHLIGHSSSTIKRVCRATVQAEAYGLTGGVEEGDRIRATIADLHNKLDHKAWEASAAAYMRQIWFTDCRSVRDSLTRSVFAKMSDKRLSIEIASLRQNLWRAAGEEVGNPTLRGELPEDATDVVRWIDTDVMVADPLTKTMEPVKLIEMLDTNVWDITQPIEAVQKKRAKQAARRKALDTWERVDPAASTFQGIDATGPSWLAVTRRVTKDARTGDVIDDDYKPQKQTEKYLYRELPKAPRDIRTIFYYEASPDEDSADESVT